MPDMGGKGAFIPLPKLSAYRFAQDTCRDDPSRVLIQLFKQLHLFGGQCLFLTMFPNFCIGHIHGGSGKFHRFILLRVGAAEDRTDPEQQFFGQERLGEIVVCTNL